jgi:peptide-methionine (S)-S-oxide reductase
MVVVFPAPAFTIPPLFGVVSMHRLVIRSAIVAAVAAPLAFLSRPSTHAASVPAPTAIGRVAAGPGLQTIVLAGGCFWGIEGVYEHIKGVTEAVSGYAGGTKASAEYETVSTGTTGHAESVRVTFDPAKVSLEKLLQVFFSVAHDPTQLNRQGPDVGPQYRSAIFFTSEEQAAAARGYIDQLTKAKTFPRPIVTQVVKLDAFYPAEEYHQNFMEKNPTYPYIVYNDRPKVENLKREFPELYR